MTKRIAILGTCVSEDWVHFQNARNRLDVVLEPRYQPSSLISIVSDPVNLDLQPGPRMTPMLETALKIDLDKSFLPTLASTQPDYLIVELTFDSRKDRGGGILAIGNSWITSSYILHRCQLPPDVKTARHLNVLDEPEAYLDLFRSSARKLADFLKNDLSDCKVILNQVRWAEYYVAEDGELRSYSPWEQRAYFRANLRLDRLEAVFGEEINCRHIFVDDVPIFADSQHIWGASADHFIRYYYTRFAEKLAACIAL